MLSEKNILNSSEVIDHIFGIISNLPETKRQEVLKDLEKIQQYQLSEKREYERKHTSIYAICSAGNLSFKDFIRNISVGGLFIETKTPLVVNTELLIRFLHSDYIPLTKVIGKTVRVDLKGVGVKFYKLLSKDLFSNHHVMHL